MSISGAGQAIDLSVCAQEPIHIPGSVEPHGVLLVGTWPELKLVQVSGNSETHLGISPSSLLNLGLGDVLTASSLRHLEAELKARDLAEGIPVRVLDLQLTGNGKMFEATVHRLHGLLYVELEPRAAGDQPASNVSHAVMTNMLAELRGSESLAALCQRAAAYVRRLTGFDRVMIYRFLEDDSGEVIAEDRRADLTPYLGLRYPASDIPQQARRLYVQNPIRLKPDVGAPGAALIPAMNPITGAPLDMTFCILRRMSPVHDEYLRNMGVTASMSLSILKDQRLWGLIACHHCTPRYVTHTTRIACEFLSEFLASQIGGKEDSDLRDYQAQLASQATAFQELLLANGSLARLFLANPKEVVSVANAGGAAICSERQILLTGNSPTREQVRDLIAWLSAHQHEYVFSANKLQDHYPPAMEFADTASGLLSVRITKAAGDFLLWFRPEVSTIINWAGNPDKPVDSGGETARINPRRSFATWKQAVAGHSIPWLAIEWQNAALLRNAIAEAMLARQNEEVTRLNVELSRSNIELDAFAYAASHDLQEPVRTIRLYAQLIMRAEGAAAQTPARDLLQDIIGASDRMNELIRGLLGYARVGGSDRMKKVSVSLDETLATVTAALQSVIQEHHAEIVEESLPQIWGDPTLIRQVFQNLISNALHYRSEQPPQVKVRSEVLDRTCVIHIQDNGIGFDPDYSERIFEVFMRLHGREVSGSGVGLAICKKIIEQHGGRIWAKSIPGKGSTFSFTLPLALHQ